MSARVDYLAWLSNHFLQISVLPLIFASGLLLATKFYHWLTGTFGYCTLKIPLTSWGVVWYSIIFLVVSDFSRFILHYLVHHYPFLWKIHKMHHTAEVLTPFTLFRVHPLEMILFHIRYLLVYSLITGGFLFLYNDFFEFPKLFGASFFVFVSNILGANLRHSNIPIGFGFLERLLISPKQHQMHHSKDPDLQESNLGSLFALWDILFSTWKPSKGVENIQFGVNGHIKQSFGDEMINPFVEWWSDIKKVFKLKFTRK
ncbi:MAG: sterol desaturase family protein [Bacteroidetes bacterium]|nr:sterol desaturase family protein [Bacteroidota bacterium]